MYIGSGASLNIAGSYTGSSSSLFLNDGDLILSGNFMSDETNMQPGLGTVYFAGSSRQTAGGHYPQFHNVVMNNTAGLDLSSDVFVMANLNFIKGIISTGNYKIIHANRGSVTNAGQSTGWVNGYQEKYFVQGLSNVRNFEIGDDTYYTPAVIGLANISVNGSVTANTVNTDHPNISSSEINASKSVNRYWSFINSGVIFDSATAVFNWVPSDEDAGSLSFNYKAALYSSGIWKYLSSQPVVSNAITVSNITALRSFAAGEYTCAGVPPAKPGSITSGQQFNLCGGGTFTYTIAAVPGATHYTWTVPPMINTVADNGTSLTLSIPSDIGRQRLYVTADNACGSSVPKTINLFSKPSKPVISGPSCVSAYQTGVVYHITNTEPNVVYNWKVPGIARITGGQGTPSVTIDWRGVPGVILSVPQNSCATGEKGGFFISTGNCNVTANSISLQKNILAYPNPTGGSCTVIFTSAKTEKCEVSVTGISGQQVLGKDIFASAGSNTIVLDLQYYPAGIYMVNIASSEGVQTVKVLKQ